MSLLRYYPRYKYELDKLYPGHQGQRNSGLEFPMRYGLTRDQVIELINAKQWSIFLNLWMSQRYKYFVRHNLLCLACQSVDIHAYVIFGNRLCRRCAKVIDAEYAGERERDIAAFDKLIKKRLRRNRL